MFEMKPLDIIIPVYRGLDETKECILSLLPGMPDWARLIVVNDCSPEPALTEWLREQAVPLAFELHENEQNKGFVGTVNFGMALHPDRDVLLLNSDVEVANSDWLERMRLAAYRHERVASLTPFSNNATICSFPHFCQDNELFAGLDVNALDRLFASLPLDDELVEVPTGVGFCMYIRRDCLDAVGYFDEQTFGKGYGEENDWCQRAHKLGWKNYHQLNVFAYHKGGVSFQEEGDPRKARALELLNALHPNYTRDVMAFIGQDPAKQARMMAKIKFVAQSGLPVVLSVTHHLGGGVAQHVSELAIHYLGKAYFLCLSPGLQEGHINLYLSALEEDKSDAFVFNIHTEYELLVAFLRELGVGRMHFHHIMGLSPRAWLLPSSLGVPYDVTIHDYYMINGNPTLTDSYGQFVSDKRLEWDEVCRQAAHIHVSGEEWRNGVLPLLSRAERIIYPCNDLYQRFSRLYGNESELSGKAVVAYHPDAQDYAIPRQTHVAGEPLRVLILGALSREKGADLLEQVALLCDPAKVEFHLLGYGYRPLRGIVNHGAYSLSQLDEKLDSIKPHVVWFPALWPETYSYTLSIALERCYPVVCPDLGAFVERTQGRSHSSLLPWDIKPLDCAAFWRAYAQGADLTSFVAIVQDDDNIEMREHFYAAEYLRVDPVVESTDGDTLAKIWCEKLSLAPTVVLLSRKERLLQYLWKIRNQPFIGAFARLIPFRLQRTIKRFLSRRPIHEIVK
ncbi:glycosyltransferase [Aeromonas allosaccharophila]|uniref:glycosyltransferase n=1 Tax=Aeromonas allosaccharophila TaxID=656 RepID=UPI00398829F1